MIESQTLVQKETTFSKQFEIVQLIPIPHDIPLNLAPHNPGNKVLHSPRDEKRRVRDGLGADTDVALLHHLGRSLHRLGHAQPRHDDGEPPPREGRHCGAVLDGRELRRAREDAHVVELLEEEGLVLASRGGLGWEEGEAVGELAEGLDQLALQVSQGEGRARSRRPWRTHSAYPVVGMVLLWLLDHIPPRNIVISVLVVLLVIDKVVLAEQSLLMIFEFANHRDGVRTDK